MTATRALGSSERPETTEDGDPRRWDILVVLCLGLVMGSATASPARRAVGASLAGAFVLAVLLNFAYLYPLLTAQPIPYSSWLAHMWYHGWI